MPRKPRIDAVGYHHVINRGINRADIFLCAADKHQFLSILIEAQQVYAFAVHSFCLLDNHYHLLLETHRNNLSLIMRYVNSQYASFFNKKNQRSGHVWQGRFKSWYVYEDNYLWLLLRYIEMNPVKAGLCSEVGEYEFSSSYCLLHGVCTDLLQLSILLQKDLSSCLAPVGEDELIELKRFEQLKTGKVGEDYVVLKVLPLADYFQGSVSREKRNWAIYTATVAGYKQSEIAEWLNLSTAVVSRIVAAEKKKVILFTKLKNRGLLWSYAPDVVYAVDKSALLIETVLKYASLQEIKTIVSLYGLRRVKLVWQDTLCNDARFKRLNYFLARVLFSMDVEADYFAEITHSRAEKLRLLAGQN